MQKLRLVLCLVWHAFSTCIQAQPFYKLTDEQIAYNDDVINNSAVIFEGYTLDGVDTSYITPWTCSGGSTRHTMVVQHVIRAPRRTIQPGDTVYITNQDGRRTVPGFVKEIFTWDCPESGMNEGAMYSYRALYFAKAPTTRRKGKWLMEFYDPIKISVIGQGGVYAGLGRVPDEKKSEEYGYTRTTFTTREAMYNYLGGYSHIQLPKDLKKKAANKR